MVMVVVAALGKAEPIKSTASCQTFDLWSWPVTLTMTFDLDHDLWPWPRPLTLKQCNSDVKHNFRHLTYDLWPTTLTNLAKFKVDLHTKYQGRRSIANGWGVRALMDKHTYGRNESHYLSALLSYAVDNKWSQNSSSMELFPSPTWWTPFRYCFIKEINADRLHACDYSHIPTDYRQTHTIALDKHLISIAVRQKLDLELWPWPVTFDLRPWPTT